MAHVIGQVVVLVSIFGTPPSVFPSEWAGGHFVSFLSSVIPGPLFVS